MTPNLWERLKPVYEAVLKTPEDERAQFVSDTCGDDPELREELGALLKSADSKTQLDRSPVAGLPYFVNTDTKPFPEGKVLLSRFKVVRHLGQGGMGDVYEAIDLELGRIALKTIRSDITGSQDLLSRFRKEVQLARRISDPHVCRIHELFVMSDESSGSSRSFLTMELLEGITLADKLCRSGPLSWVEAQKISIQICEGLQSIHREGIIHRDLKSRNIMLSSRNGETCAILMDFGLARELSTPTSATLTACTELGVVAGTPDYMAPEQFEGKELSPATDVYSLGIVLYELVTGKHPFAASSPVGAAVSRGRRPRLASSLQKGLPGRCDSIICKCLEFDPANRYQSAKEVADDLKGQFFSGSTLRQRWRKLAVGAACLLLVLCSLLLIPASRDRIRGILFSSREKHIVILPFDVAGNDPDTVALASGLMDSLTGRLSNLEATNNTLWVVPTSEIRKHGVTDASTARKKFGANIVARGHVDRSNGEVHLTVTLVDAQKMRQIGFVDVQNRSDDLGALQDDAITSMGRLMNLSVRSDSAVGGEGSVKSPAYEDYLAAIGYMQRYDKPGNLESAISLLQNAMKTDPRFALGLARLGEAYRLRYVIDPDPRWLQEAQTYCRQAAELDDRVPTTYVTLARIHEQTGNHDLAVHEFQRALDIDPRNADALTGIAHSFENAGHNAEAEAAYLKAAAVRPSDWNGYNNLGNFYSNNGRYPESIAQYHRALELTPDNSVVYGNLGVALLNSGDPKMLAESERTLKKSIAISPSFAAYSNLGVLYDVQHRFHDSIAASRQALQLNDQHYDVWNNLADAYEWTGDKEKARSTRQTTVKLVERAIKLNPQDAEAHAALAALFAKAGLKEKADENIQTSLALSPDNPYVLCDVADAYELLGDRKRAISYLRQALHNGFPAEQLNANPDFSGILADPALKVASK
jgi:serine/threonine protein kinase/tetratricopeptide (TPR) repeat protein